MSVELPIVLDDDVAEEIRADLADGRRVTLQIDADEAGELSDLIDYQLETAERASEATEAYREWKQERDEPTKSRRLF